MVTKQLNIENRTLEQNYFWSDLININDFDPNLLKLDKKWTLIFITLAMLRKNLSTILIA